MAEPKPVPALPERLTQAEAGPTLLQLERALAQAEGPVVAVDAGALRRFDSSAVAVLLELRRGLQARGLALEVRHWPPRLRELVTLYGVGDLLPA